MEQFEEFLAKITDAEQRARTKEVLDWVAGKYPELEPRIAWRQPLFTHHGTYIIGFSVAAKHLAVSPEQAGMVQFSQEIEQAGYGQGNMLFRILWSQSVNYDLLAKMIDFNCLDKADCKTFWRV